MNKQVEDFQPPNQNFEPKRPRLVILVGRLFRHGDAIYRICQVLDYASAIGIDIQSGLCAPLRIGELRPFAEEGALVSLPIQFRGDLTDIGDESWRLAQKRFALIKPLLNAMSVDSEVEYRAKRVLLSVATLNRWLRRYKTCGGVAGLFPKKPGCKTSAGRIPPYAEEVIQGVIGDFYLTPQRPSAQKTLKEMLRRCWLRGIEAPNLSTIRAHLSRVMEMNHLRKSALPVQQPMVTEGTPVLPSGLIDPGGGL